MPSADSRNHAVGIGLLLVVVALWTVSSFLTSHILVGGETYDKPFFITWLCTASFSLYLIPTLAIRPWRDRKGKQKSRDEVASVPVLASGSFSDAPLTTRETAILACQFCFLWFAANYAMNASLSLTTVSSMTVLSATSGLFTLVIGRLAAVESFNMAKLGAVLMSIVGVAMVSRSDSAVSSSQTDSALTRHRLLGDGLALTSALLYGVYVIFLKLKIGNESRISMPLFFGFVGAANICLLWPFWVLLDLLGVETFARPPSSQVWLSLLCNALITFVSDFLYILAMLKTSPLLVTVGLSLTIPAAVTIDLLRGTEVGSLLLFLLGAVLVVSAFVVVGLAGESATPLLRDERMGVSEDDA